MNRDLSEIILSEEQIAQKVREAAAWLDERFKKENVPPLAVGVLKGCVFFFCDLVRAMQTPVQIEL